MRCCYSLMSWKCNASVLIDTPSQQFHIYYYIVSKRRKNRKIMEKSTFRVFRSNFFLVFLFQCGKSRQQKKNCPHHSALCAMFTLQCIAMGQNNIHNSLFCNSNSVCAHAKEKLPIKVLNFFSCLILAQPTRE